MKPPTRASIDEKQEALERHQICLPSYDYYRFTRKYTVCNNNRSSLAFPMGWFIN